MKKGFTLIELLVVVLIIGILSAIAIPQYQQAVRKSRAVKQLTLFQSLRKALDLFYISSGGETPTLDALDIEMPPDADDFDTSVNKNSTGYYAAVSNKQVGGSERFVLRYFIACREPEYVGKAICVGEGPGGIKACQGLGGTGKHSYKFISRQTAYYLE